MLFAFFFVRLEQAMRILCRGGSCIMRIAFGLFDSQNLSSICQMSEYYVIRTSQVVGNGISAINSRDTGIHHGQSPLFRSTKQTIITLVFQSYLVGRCLDPQTPPEKALWGSKHRSSKGMTGGFWKTRAF